MDPCADLQPSSYSRSLCPGYTTHSIYFVLSGMPTPPFIPVCLCLVPLTLIVLLCC